MELGWGNVADDAANMQAEEDAGFRIAWDRKEHDPCQKGTEGCCVDHAHDRERGSDDCETW